MNAMIYGALLALGLILPLGVQNVFILNQGITQRRFLLAMPAVITAGICDTFLILLAVLGVSVLVFAITWIKVIFMIIGILFLIYMGVVTWNSKPQKMGNSSSLSPKKQILFAASVSLFNPHAILDTVGVIGTSSVQFSGDEKVIFTVTCIAVSWIWFLLLALVGRLSGTLDKTGRFIFLLSKVSALFIFATAIYFMFTLSQMYGFFS